MFEQTFKNIDDILWKDAGCSFGEVNWKGMVITLKKLSDLENIR